MRAVTYSVSEALASLWRGRRASLVSMITIATALLVLGAVLLLGSNVDRLVTRWSDAAEMSVYLHDDATSDAVAAVEQILSERPLVAGFEFVSKEEARRRFVEDFADLADLDDPDGENPFPASFEVRFDTVAGETSDAEQLARQLEGAGGVEEVRFDQAWIDRLVGVVDVARRIGFGVVMVLAIAGALTVANVVRLACFARRDEIEIMHLVGAPLLFVRGPFVAEGVLQGGVGGCPGPRTAVGNVPARRLHVRRGGSQCAGRRRPPVPAGESDGGPRVRRDGRRVSRRGGCGREHHAFRPVQPLTAKNVHRTLGTRISCRSHTAVLPVCWSTRVRHRLPVPRLLARSSIARSSSNIENACVNSARPTPSAPSRRWRRRCVA